MPQRLKTLCRYPGCRRPTRNRYCNEHLAWAHRRTDVRRGTSAERGYDKAWSKVAAWRRHLDFGLCQDCKAHDVLTLSSIVDHTVPIYVRPDWRLAIGNTRVLCDLCHKRKTSDDLRKYGHRIGTPTPQQLENRQRANELDEPPRYSSVDFAHTDRWGES
jgi:5-methylcytosine-specific restriction protein A